MVTIRFKRFGRNHRNYYRLGVMDSRKPRDGVVLEELGTYDPEHPDAARQFVVNVERIQHWIKNGAQPSHTVKTLLRKQGLKVS